MGVSALGPHVGPHPSAARCARLDAGAGKWSSGQVRLPMLAGSSAPGPNPPDSRSGQKTPILPRSVQGKSPLLTSRGQAVWKAELPQSGTPGAAAPGKAELLHCPWDPPQPSSGLRSLDARPRCQALRNSPQKEGHRVKQVPSMRPRAERGHVKRSVGSRPRNSNTPALKGQGSQTTSFGLCTLSWVHQGTD